MADSIRSIGSVPAPSVQPGVSAARSEAVRAAQRAFFDAALGKPSAPKPGEASAKRPQNHLAKSASETVFDPKTPPSTLLRPGSLLDIKV